MNPSLHNWEVSEPRFALGLVVTRCCVSECRGLLTEVVLVRHPLSALAVLLWQPHLPELCEALEKRV